MIVTVSNLDGIKQYRLPDNIGKMLIFLITTLILLISFLVWNLIRLNGEINNISSQTNQEILQAKKSVGKLQEKLSTIERQYRKLQDEKEKQEHLYMAKIMELEDKHRVILAKWQSKQESTNSDNKQFVLAKEKLHALEKRLQETEAKLKKEMLRNSNLSKKIKQEKERIAKLLQRKESKVTEKKKKEHLTKKQKEKQKRRVASKKKEKRKGKVAQKKKREKRRVAQKKKKKKVSKYSSRTEKIFQIAKKELGKRYVWGAVGPKTFDCSGFTSYVYRKIGINIPRTSKQQAKYGKLVHRDQLKPGDLIFFDTNYRRKGIDHVGIYIGNNKFIHASSARKRVIITSLNKAFYKQRFKLARRIN